MRRARTGLLLALLLGCTTPEVPWPLPGAGADAQVSVELWSGIAQAPAAEARGPEPVEILLDMTTSMKTRTRGKPPRYMAAREAAARLLDELPRETRIGVRALGISRGAACVEPTLVAQGPAGSLGRGLSAHLRALRPRSETSLAGALERVLREAGAPLDRTRVVVFTDLGDECGGDLCAAGAALTAAGARIDFVLLGEARVPECFAEFAPTTPPHAAASSGPAPSPGFRVLREGLAPDAPGAVLARGRANAGAVAVPPGTALVVVEVQPPALIGPMRLEPGSLTRIHVLDFPSLDPPVREWGWESVPSDAPSARGQRSTPPPKAATPAERRAVAQSG